MKHLYTYMSIFLVFSLSSVGAQAKGANYTAHEWGTFTSLVGSNGRTVNGMYHEDEPLPSFVHGFGELVSEPIFQPGDPCEERKIPCRFIDNNIVTQKMETPVIYFYSKENQALDVTVDVKFPTGAVTETYPGPTFTTPRRDDAPILANGHTIFNVKVYPMNVKPADLQIPHVEPGNIYGHARQVHSSYVRARNELEKFIFYRGVGQFQPDLRVSSARGELRVYPGADNALPKMLLLHVSPSGEVRAIDLANHMSKAHAFVSRIDIQNLRDHGSPLFEGTMDRKLAFAHIRDQMLVPSGLTLSEAQAMIDTWEHGYLSVPGLRLLYVLPPHEVHRLLPLELTPAPADVVRVFVGRLEVMLDTDETDLMNKVIAAGDLIDVAQLGRFAESLLRRTLEVYLNRSEFAVTGPDQAVVDTFNRLIARAKSIGLN